MTLRITFDPHEACHVLTKEPEDQAPIFQSHVRPLHPSPSDHTLAEKRLAWPDSGVAEIRKGVYCIRIGHGATRVYSFWEAIP